MAKKTLTLPDRPRVQVIGLCRFSYLGSGGFKVLHDGTLDQRRAMLYDPARLEARMVWFEQVFLPGISHQTDPDFTMLILAGTDFPEPWRSRLEWLIHPHPQFRMVYRPPGNHREVCADVMREVVEPDADVLAEFRLDDDDGVAVDYVAELRRDFTLLRDLYAQKGRLALDYSLGLVLDDRTAIAGGVVADKRFASCWGCALTLFVAPSQPEQILDYVHYKVWHHMPSVMRSDRVMFLRGAHQSNDSIFRRPEQAALVPRDRLRAQLAKRFRVDLDHLEQTLAGLGTGRPVAVQSRDAQDLQPG